MKEDLNMKEQVIGEKMWGHLNFNITLWSDRGKGRAQIVQYRRRAASQDKRSHNAIHIARIVMGARLIGFLIHESYQSARFIPYIMLADTERGNGCLGEDGDGKTRWLCTKRGEIGEDTLPEWIQKIHQSNKMVDLNELRFFGKYSINYDVDEFVPENSMFDKNNFTMVVQMAEEDEVKVVQGNAKEELVFSRIVIYKKSSVSSVPYLMIFQ